MRCPRCNSSRVQRGYHDVPMALHFFGLRKLLCNKCGLEFKGLDPLSKVERKPQYEIDRTPSRRRVPRYTVHLPATFYLAENTGLRAKASQFRSAMAHCKSISRGGLTLSFVGTRLTDAEVSRVGQLLFVTVQLPNSPIEAVVSIIKYQRYGYEDSKRLVTATFYEINESDTERLEQYLERCAERQPVVMMD